MSIPLSDRPGAGPAEPPVPMDAPPFSALFRALERYLRRWQGRRDLAALDGRLLQDIGVTPEDARGSSPDRPGGNRPAARRRVGVY